MLKASVTEVCITPPVGVQLSGYFAPQGRPSTDIHDDLTAQALVLDDGGTRVALITSDLLAVTPDFVQKVRGEVRARTGIEHVMVSCAHVHTAPATLSGRDIGAADPEYVHMAARHMAGAVVASAGRLAPAKLSIGRGAHHGLAWNRLGQDDVNPALAVVRIDIEEGASALLVHYACHPVMLGPKPIISADYPGALRRSLKRRFPGVVMFANGAAGDIDPASNSEMWGEATFEDVARAGEALAAAAWHAAEAAEPVDALYLEVRQASLRLDLDIPSLEAIRAQIARHQADLDASGGAPDRFTEVTGAVKMPRFWLSHYRDLQARIEAGAQPGHIDAELQAFVVPGALALLGVPGEVFTAQGRAIQEASPHTLPVCYANGAYGYLPPRWQYEVGGYAATLAAAVHGLPPFKPGVAERLVEVAIALLK